jgi:hypothetical protein
LLLDPSSAHQGDNMIKTTPMQNKALACTESIGGVTGPHFAEIDRARSTAEEAIGRALKQPR